MAWARSTSRPRPERVSGSTRCSWFGSGHFTVSTFRPSWSTSGPANCWTWALVAAVPNPWDGWPNKDASSGTANTKLDECRRRVQNETLGHRGRNSDPLYRCRRLLTKAKERLDDKGSEKLKGLLRAGDPNGDVATCWEAKEAVRESYVHADAEVALEWVTQLGHDLQDKDYPIEARSLGRTLIRWRHQIAAWHLAHLSNGPTEAVNNLIKRVKRAASLHNRRANTV